MQPVNDTMTMLKVASLAVQMALMMSVHQILGYKICLAVLFCTFASRPGACTKSVQKRVSLKRRRAHHRMALLLLDFRKARTSVSSASGPRRCSMVSSSTRPNSSCSVSSSSSTKSAPQSTWTQSNQCNLWTTYHSQVQLCNGTSSRAASGVQCGSKKMHHFT